MIAGYKNITEFTKFKPTVMVHLPKYSLTFMGLFLAIVSNSSCATYKHNKLDLPLSLAFSYN